MKTRSKMAVMVVVGAMALGACGPGGTPQGAKPGRELVVALSADLETFNEYQSAGEAMENAVIDLLFPTLFEEQPDFSDRPPSFAPRLAESWAFTPNRFGLRVKLRQDAVWSDGFRITADDVRFTFAAQRSEEVGSLFVEQKSAIQAVQVLDSFTVLFLFKRAYPYQLMDANDGHIIPVHAWSRVEFAKWPTTDFTPDLVTGGPFRLASRTPQQTTVLERDPKYWNPAHIDRLVLRIIPDGTSQVGQLLAGTVHFLPMVPPREAARLRQAPNVRVVDFPSRLLGFLAWNNRRPALADRRVRQALGLAVNRQALVETVYQGFAALANGPVLSTMWAHNREIPALPFDPERARALLGEAGFSDADRDGVLEKDGKPLELELLYPATNTIRAQIAVLVQSDLARVGVRVTPRPVEFAALMARLEGGDFDAVVTAWEESTKVDLASGWATPGAERGTGNFFGYSNPEVDRVLEEVAEAADLERTRVLLHRAQALIVADQPVMFLYEARRIVAFSRQLEHATPNAASVFFGIHAWELAP